MSAIVGVEGLEATYEAVRLGKRVGWRIKKFWWPAASWSSKPRGNPAPN